MVGASHVMMFRRCPTLPHPPGCSTIGAVGLSFRVRNGTGRFPHAMTAVTLLPAPPVTWCGGGEILWLQLADLLRKAFGGVVIQLCWFRAVTTRVLGGCWLGTT